MIDEGNKKRLKKFLLVIMWIFSLVLIWHYFSPDLTLPYNEQAEFRITPNDGENQYIRDYLLKYNFEENKGVISFRYWSAYKENAPIRVQIPKELNFTKWNITLEKSGISLKDRYQCNIQSDGKTNSYLNCFLSGTVDEGVIFYVEFSSLEKNFYPNGLFIIGNDFPSVTGYDNYSTGERNVILEFNLGKKYKCSEPCFVNDYVGSSTNKNLNYYLENNKLKLYVTPGSESEDLKFSRFRLNTYNYKEERCSFLLLTLGISLLAGIIVLLLEHTKINIGL